MASATILPVVEPADHVSGPPQGRWTNADYRQIPDDGTHYEVIEGVLYMAPAPTDVHQAANRWFIYHLTAHVKLPGIGAVFGAPFDVKLPGGATVQPDVLVVLMTNVGRITAEGVMGPPDLVVEIASPSTATYDRDKKLHAYERGGVTEYWIADLMARAIELFVLDQGVYRSRGIFQGAAMLPSIVVPALPVRVEQFFA